MIAQRIAPERLWIWVHTWWKRDGVRQACLNSLDASDAKQRYTVERQDENTDRVSHYINTLTKICNDPRYDWMLRLEDDVIVNKHIIHNVCTWDVPHVEPDFGIGFLTVPGLVLLDYPHLGEGKKTKTPYRKYEQMHFGGAMLFNLKTLRTRIDKIAAFMVPKTVHDRTHGFSCAPSYAFYQDGLHSYFHLPALAKIDLSIPRSRDGHLIPERVYGEQPYEATWKR